MKEREKGCGLRRKRRKEEHVPEEEQAAVEEAGAPESVQAGE